MGSPSREEPKLFETVTPELIVKSAPVRTSIGSPEPEQFADIVWADETESTQAFTFEVLKKKNTKN